MPHKLHPLNALGLLAVLMAGTLFIQHPLYAFILALALGISVAAIGGTEELKWLARFWIATALMILVINPLLSNQGDTLLLRVVLPLIGNIRITAESVAFGGHMVLRLFSMVLAIKLFGLAIDRDDFFGYLSRYMNKLVLTMSMTVNMIHRLRLEIKRVREVMTTRGLDLDSGGLFRRIRSYYPLIKVVLISSLEGSLDRAEALHSRGYGRGRRSFYRSMEMTPGDRLHAALLIFYALILGAGFWRGYLAFSYFPALGAQRDFSLLYFALHGLSLGLLIEGTRRCSAWKFSTSKI